jgi:hypothetical protein
LCPPSQGGLNFGTFSWSGSKNRPFEGCAEPHGDSTVEELTVSGNEK